MRTLIWAIVILAIAAGIALECRYALVIDSPVVAKIDRLTGEVWIVNSGVWMQIQHSPEHGQGQAFPVATAAKGV